MTGVLIIIYFSTEHKEASENPIQQVPCQHGRAPSREDSAAGRAGHPRALHEVFSGTAAGGP